MCDLSFANEQYLSYPLCLDVYRPISALLMSKKTEYSFCFLVLIWLPCFSNIHFRLPLALRVATFPIFVSSLPGSPVAGLKYTVLQNTGTHIDQKQRLKHNRVYFVTFAVNPMCLLSTCTRSHTHKSVYLIVSIFPLQCSQHLQNLQI